MWQWFLTNGDKVFATITALSALLANSTELFDADVIKWVTFGAAVATVIHNTFLPAPTPVAK